MDRRAFLATAAAPLVLGPSALAAPRGGVPVALVTADLESSIVAVGLPNGRIVRRLATPPGPRAIESFPLGALVAHTAHGRVSFVDARTLEVDEVDGAFSAPRYAAVDANGQYAYVTDSERGEVVVVDFLRRRAVGRVAVGGPARHLGRDPAGRWLWVALGTKAERLAILSLADPQRPRVVGTLRPPFLAHDVGFTPGGRRVWVTSGDRGRVAIYDARTGRLLRAVAADAPPQHVTFLGDRAFVTSGDDAVLRVHSLDGRLLRSAPIPVGSYNVQHGFGLVLTPSLSQGTLCTFSARGAPIEQTRIARSSHDACFVMTA
jgi:hypothetical protein